MVVTRSYASKYNIKLNSGLQEKKEYKNHNHYVFTFLYFLFCLLMPIFLYCVLLYFTNYYYNKNVNNALMTYKEYNFILLENNLPEKTFEYLSDNLYNKLPAKPYEQNFNYFDYLFNEILYNYDVEDNYNYYIDFF